MRPIALLPLRLDDRAASSSSSLVSSSHSGSASVSRARSADAVVGVAVAVAVAIESVVLDTPAEVVGAEPPVDACSASPEVGTASGRGTVLRPGVGIGLTSGVPPENDRGGLGAGSRRTRLIRCARDRTNMRGGSWRRGVFGPLSRSRVDEDAGVSSRVICDLHDAAAAWD